MELCLRKISLSYLIGNLYEAVFSSFLTAYWNQQENMSGANFERKLFSTISYLFHYKIIILLLYKNNTI
jgi:hypothetical protein